MPELMESDAPLVIRELTALQRRILGTLVEKGVTTPEQYPLTLKGLTTGCNQKSNRDPVTNYDEDAVAQGLDQLREIGLVAEIFSDSGRTPRYRHYMRHRFKFSEAQLAILTELLLRGRQSLGELRARASRMHPIETLEELRHELEALIAQQVCRSDGPLDRRGCEVDHNWYPARERPPLLPRAEEFPPRAGGTAVDAGSAAAGPAPRADEQARLEDEVRALRAELAAALARVAELEDRVARIQRELGLGA